MRYFTHYWNNQTWYHHYQQGIEGNLLNHTASNLFRKKGITTDDIVYIVTIIKGTLHVLSKLQVGKVCNIEEVAQELQCHTEDLWQANDHILAKMATPMNFNCKVPIGVAQQLLFVANVQETKPPLFISPGILDQQTLRGIRELTSESASQLDQLLPELQPVREEVSEIPVEIIEFNLPEEIIEPETYYEGSTKRISVNIYERNPKARKACIQYYGTRCCICAFDFESTYGNIGKGIIHVHHLKPLSEIGEAYELDPIRDLRPVCPNCHTIIHKRNPAYSCEEIQQMLKENAYDHIN